MLPQVKSEHWDKPVTMRRELSPIIPQDTDGKDDDVEYWQVSSCLAGRHLLQQEPNVVNNVCPRT